MSQGDCKLQAAGLDRVQWAFVELMVVAEERVTAMETSAKHSPPAVFPCSPVVLAVPQFSGTDRAVAHQQRRAQGG